MLAICAVVFVAALAGAEARSPYIIGGGVSAKGRWPHQVSLLVKPHRQPAGFKHICGGSILNERWILTTARCILDGLSGVPSDWKVRVGMFQISAGDYEQELGVEDMFQHPGWGIKDGMPYDMALVKVAEPIDLANPHVSAIPMATPSATYAGNPDCWISGWGRDDRSSMRHSDVLREARENVLTNPECKEKFGMYEDVYGPVAETHICAGNPDRGDAYGCNGDEGGPLMCKRNGVYELVGVASRTGPRCNKLPTVFMRVSAFLDWIKTTIAENEMQ